LFFSAALQGDDPRLGVAEDAPDDGRRAEAGEAVRVGEAHDFSHAAIMPGFPSPENKKTHGKMAASASIRSEKHPLTWEKSPINQG
jgi:hypothetical protein